MRSGLLWYLHLPGSWWWGKSSDEVEYELDLCRILRLPDNTELQYQYIGLSADCNGNNIDFSDLVYSLQECQYWCDQLSECAGVSYSASTAKCIRKSASCDEAEGTCDQSRSFCFYRKESHDPTVAPSKSPSETTKCGVEGSGGGIIMDRIISSEMDSCGCKEICDSHEECTGWTYVASNDDKECVLLAEYENTEANICPEFYSCRTQRRHCSWKETTANIDEVECEDGRVCNILINGLNCCALYSSRTAKCPLDYVMCKRDQFCSQTAYGCNTFGGVRPCPDFEDLPTVSPSTETPTKGPTQRPSLVPSTSRPTNFPTPVPTQPPAPTRITISQVQRYSEIPNCDRLLGDVRDLNIHVFDLSEEEFISVTFASSCNLDAELVVIDVSIVTKSSETMRSITVQMNNGLFLYMMQQAIDGLRLGFNIESTDQAIVYDSDSLRPSISPSFRCDISCPEFKQVSLSTCSCECVAGRYGLACDAYSPLWINEVSVEEHEILGERRWKLIQLELAGDEGLNLKDHLFYFMTVNATGSPISETQLDFGTFHEDNFFCQPVNENNMGAVTLFFHGECVQLLKFPTLLMEHERKARDLTGCRIEGSTLPFSARSARAYSFSLGGVGSELVHFEFRREVSTLGEINKEQEIQHTTPWQWDDSVDQLVFYNIYPVMAVIVSIAMTTLLFWSKDRREDLIAWMSGAFATFDWTSDLAFAVALNLNGFTIYYYLLLGVIVLATGKSVFLFFWRINEVLQQHVTTEERNAGRLYCVTHTVHAQWIFSSLLRFTSYY